MARLVFGTAAEPTPRFEALLPPLVRAAPVGAGVRMAAGCRDHEMASRVRDQDGAALIIDYGHLPQRRRRYLSGHRPPQLRGPVEKSGQADITAHVDFQALARAAEDLGARVHGPVPQGDFLRRSASKPAR
jgi:hypothetical protein